MDDSKIYDELRQIHERLAVLPRIDEWLKEHVAEDNRLFHGDGSDDNPGLIRAVRVVKCCQ